MKQSKWRSTAIAVADQLLEYGRLPSYLELSRATGFSTATIANHLVRMQMAGLLKRYEGEGDKGVWAINDITVELGPTWHQALSAQSEEGEDNDADHPPTG